MSDDWLGHKMVKAPNMPENVPSPAMVVLGRFQPFHRGHASLIEAALNHSQDMPIRIAIGSADKIDTMENPWSWEERELMIRCWLDAEYPSIDAEIVSIPDINDPPNWVTYANKYHGGPGILFTSDGPTADLYGDGGWPIISANLENRESWQGWRIRSTLKMLSTVSERNAVVSVMSESIPDSVCNLLFDNGWLTRLAFLGRDFEVVG